MLFLGWITLKFFDKLSICLELTEGDTSQTNQSEDVGDLVTSEVIESHEGNTLFESCNCWLSIGFLSTSYVSMFQQISVVKQKLWVKFPQFTNCLVSSYQNVGELVKKAVPPMKTKRSQAYTLFPSTELVGQKK